MKGKERAHDAPEDGLWKLLPPHRDEEQVKLDVARAFVYYPNGEYYTYIKSYQSPKHLFKFC